MNVIYKFPLKRGERETEIFTYWGAKFVSATRQGDDIVVYALVDTAETKNVKYKIIVCPTGIEIPDNNIFIDTVIYDEFVFHILETLC